MSRTSTPGRHLQSANDFILQHRVAAWTIWVLLFLTFSDVVAEVTQLAERQTSLDPTWMAWILLGYIILDFAVALALHRIIPRHPKDLVALRWTLANAPLLMSLCMTPLGTPQWLISVSLIGAIVVMISATRHARRSMMEEPADDLPD